MKKAISTDKAPAAIGPYSQAVVAGNLVFVSGQIPLDPATGQFAGDDIQSQTKQSLTNIKSILEEAGLTMDDIVKMNVSIKNMDDFGAMNEVYASFLSEPYPARAAVEVARLPKDALVEIEAIALIS